MDPAVALARGLARQSGEDRFEDMGLPFQERLRSGFQALARDFPDRCAMVDANQTPEAIAQDIARIVEAWL
jgi:dTMP kinase